MNRFRLDGKIAVVTGASSGLGVAFAHALAAAGANLVLGARRESRLRETADAVATTAVAVPTDVTKVEDCGRLVAAGMDTFGRVDVLINNAGTGGEYHPATEDTPEHFRSVVDLNLQGAYWMAQACGRVMEPGSSVVNISSVMALTTAKMPAAAYSASKAGLLGLTRDLAAQWGSRGIRVNALLPGVFPSEATAHYSENYRRKVIDAKIPLGRIGDPADVAAAAVFLASDAAAYITGVSLPVDGGVLIN
ncbi:SDR family NAD(P)-dependent oxidoreductase [Amycolatopsis thermoflava]|uniref:SDR family NAD(P)-dependent oxidoreductase n=1 Tax=Amycolatopsis thermoflava TaxID=84480 RepID=UPI00381D36BB